MTLVVEPGEAFQFDWSENWAVLAGGLTKVQVAHFKLSHSRAFYMRAFLLQTHEMQFGAHNHAFRVFAVAYQLKEAKFTGIWLASSLSIARLTRRW